ncbi:exonuclease V, chloroplastic isoform X1 [Rhizophagus clarus]|uniref:Exonuclease V, chloroplastic isoform X1 n=1 Tax=Rhizophagus clarus TaxID=94130 RepID=A0A8H3LAT1_9GLOM|nr:exonuclease V, chloroplastic isoform X1 [Rhizophagus clarus]
MNTVSSDIKIQNEKSPLELFRSSNYLSVTDLSSFAWCEFQQHNYLISGRKKESLATKIGSEIHDELELRQHDIISITVQTEEDKWDTKLYNMIFGIDSLFADLKTRELPQVE